jgi:Ras-related protein Rab-33B
MNSNCNGLQFIFLLWFQLFETSAQDERECDNVEAIFLTLAHKLKNHRPMMPEPAISTRGNDVMEALCRADVISVTHESAPSSLDDSGSCFC